MNLSLSLGSGGLRGLAVLWQDGERVLCRGWREEGDVNPTAVLAVLSASDHPTPGLVNQLVHEYELKDELKGLSAVRPLSLVRTHGRTVLLLEDPGGEPLARLLGQPMEMGRFLRFALGLSAALRQLHQRSLIHKDIKPANVLVNSATGQVWLTGFGIASRLPRERQSPEPPELVVGTLPYMAPEQTGRMNRSIDSRSDLYSFGVTLYEMITGTLPFVVSDPMEWVHCHIARQPVPPIERVKDLPITVSAIVSKLLVKTPEDRYQTAAGVESDLRRCLVQWELEHRIDEFALCQHDTSDRLLVPEKLYGRAREIDTLLAAFDRVVTGGVPELVLVSGYSGIGKSSLVSELHKVLVRSGGLFAAGKFDQYKRDIPYATLAQAFQSLVRRLLGRSEVELQRWRDELRQALDPNGLLIVDIVPELKLIIGEQPPVPNLLPRDAQTRFQLVFRRFINVFARPEHPLALFLDDLQWLDAATLDLLQDLMTQPDVQHLLLIGAYRDNEVNDTHPLVRKLQAIRKNRSRVHDIILEPLTHVDLGQLIADSLHCELEHAAPLAELVREKTAGNPFFMIQFLYALTEERFLTFDHDRAQWRWDLDRIHAKGYTDNVVDLMVGKLARLPAETRRALQQLACLGNNAEIAMLTLVLGAAEEQVHAALWPAVRLELVERQAGAYRFIHDRVQEAAYSLLPEAMRTVAHLRIGRILAAQTPPEKREEALFEIVNQLNRGADLITSREEREQLAETNLLAGKRAKASAAYASALSHLIAGVNLLAKDGWERRRDLIFQLELHRAECEFLTGALTTAEERLNVLSHRAATTVDQATVACLRADLYTTLGQASRAIAVSLDYLRALGADWSARPTEENVRHEYERIWSQLGARSIEELIDLPLMSDAESLATLDVLTKLLAPAMFTDANLASLVICRAVNLSLERGNSDGSCFAYVTFGMVAGGRFDDYQAAFRFARLGYELVEQRGLKRFQARTYMNFGNVALLWTRHVRAGRDLIRRAFEAAKKIGDLTYASYACYMMITNLLAAGDPLAEVEREAEAGLAFAREAQFGFVIDIIATQIRLVQTLRGLTPTFGSFEDEQFDELRIERCSSSSPELARVECWYWIRKLQARFFAGDYGPAIEASSRAQRLLWTSPLLFETAEFHFYSALSLAAFCDSLAADQRAPHLEALAIHHRQLRIWAENCPENFENRAALVGAETARIEGRALDAMDLYEQAIRSAQANGFVHNEALANELAGRFYIKRGLEKNGYAHLRDAHSCYAKWGADGKVRELDRLYPRLAASEEHHPPATISSAVQQLDAASVVKASQALSSEIVLSKLIEQLMTIALENAGADRGLLILPADGDHLVRAEARDTGDQIEVVLCQNAIDEIICPESLVRYVIRTHESVLLDDASRANLFSEDNYLRERRPKSILCLPIINQAQLTGLLYLENKLTSYAFTPDRIAVLELLAAQAAISLKNTLLYSDLQEREAKIRRLVDSNIIGIYLWEIEGRIIEANETFLRVVGYDRDDLVSGRVRWTDLTPPEWRDLDARAIDELRMAGRLPPVEKEYFRKDGSRVPVLIGSAAFDERRSQGVAFVLDLTERKRAEEELRESEELWRAVFENNPTMYFMLDAAGTIVSVNPFGAEKLGYTVDELVGSPVLNVFHEADRDAVQRNVAACFEELGLTTTWEFRKLRKDGTMLWVRETARAMLIKHRPVALIVCEDVTDRKRAEYLARQVFERSPDRISIVERDYRYQRVNPAFERRYGRPAETFVGTHVADLLGVEGFEQTAKGYYARCFAGEEVSFAGWFNIALGRRYLAVTYSPLQPASEQVEAVLVISRDLTEQMLALEDLREAQMELAHANRVATMGQLTASIAHEINQPITGAVTNAQAALRWLEARPPNLEEVRQALDRIVQDANRAGDVIGRIRELIRKAPPRKDRVDMNEAIREVIELARGEAAKNGASVQTALGVGLPPVEGDRVQLQQVVLNLIMNAVQAMGTVEDGPRVLSITTTQAESEGVLIAVKDSGPGVTPVDLEQLFDAFYTTKADGLGMGLSICRSIVEAHGGRLWATANLPQGAIFNFTVPAHSESVT